MPSATQRIEIFRQFSLQYALQPSSAEHILQTLPSWHSALLQVRQETRTTLKTLKDDLTQHNDYASLVENLRWLHTPELSLSDIGQFLEESLILHLVLAREDRELLMQRDELSGLLKISTELLLPLLSQNTRDAFRKHSAAISGQLLPDQRYLCWQLLLSEHPFFAPFSPAKIHQLKYLQQYLMKRQLGMSPEQEASRMLWINTQAPAWQQVAFNTTEAKNQKRVNLHLSLTAFALAWLSDRHEDKDTRYLLWANPLLLTQAGQGKQIQLFGEQSSAKAQLDTLKENTFHTITLDLRKEQTAYPYFRNLLRQSGPALTEQFASPDAQSNPGQAELLLSCAEASSENSSLLLLLLQRDFLSGERYRHLRQYLIQHYPQIFVVDFIQEKKVRGAACAVFLVNKAQAQSKGRIQYAALSMHATAPKLDFEDISWSSIDPHRQSYWIGLPESDFFELMPLAGTDASFFKESTEDIQCIAAEWLMDDDEQCLRKKVKHLIKTYQKGLSPGKTLSEKIAWPKTLRQMALQGIPLEFNDAHIRKVMLRPSVETFLYADEMLLDRIISDFPQIVVRRSSADATGSVHPVHVPFFSEDIIFPLRLETETGVLDNISDKARDAFRDFYRKRARSLDSHFIVFPPENITQTLDKIASVSRDLPVLRKYPEQINRMLSDARDFTSDVELLAPPYEKIEEFRRKVLLLERDAIERKVIYQRVKNYINELKEQLSMLTREYDEAQRDLEAVTKENLFFYVYAVLQDTAYAARYQAHLQWELPRIPMYPHFRKWMHWGRELFSLHSRQKKTAPYPLQKSLEAREKGRAKKFSYKLNQEEGTLLLEEGLHSLLIEGILPEVFQYKLFGKTLPEHYLSQLQEQAKWQSILPQQFQQPTLPDAADAVFQQVAECCAIAVQTMRIRQEMDNAGKAK